MSPRLFSQPGSKQPALELWTLILLVLIACLLPKNAEAQITAPQPVGQLLAEVPRWEPPVKDNGVFRHVLFEQLEGRTNGADNELRWDGEGWIGTDMNRLLLRSEAFAGASEVRDGDLEALYDRPIPRLRYFDAQAGIREDLDSGPQRTWGAVGVEGLAPYRLELQAAFYFRDGGHLAGRTTAFYDLRISQRLIAQPELELNFYGKDDPQRGIGSGLSELDGGLRLRYEINRKFAPYAGFTYNGRFGNTAAFSRRAAEPASGSECVFGFRVWY